MTDLSIHLFPSRVALPPAALGAAPCDQCHHRARCREWHMACSDFARFVATGAVCFRNRTPSRDEYFRLFGAADGEEK